MKYAIKYYRTREVSETWRRAGINKPAGWVAGKMVYPNIFHAQKEADHLIGRGATAEVVVLGHKVICPACGEEGKYWEDRIPVHDSVTGSEIREAGIEHADGRFCTEWETTK